MRVLHNPEILRHVVPQNDKKTFYCHAELVEASRLPALSTYAKVSLLIRGANNRGSLSRENYLPANEIYC